MIHHAFTRKELHALVWSKPLKTLSAELGLSDTGLKKICKRHHIPTPPQGHWIRIHHGRSPAIIPLPEFEDADPTARIEFLSTASRTPAAARDELARLKHDARAGDAAEPDFAPRPTNELHPALVATAKHLRAATPDRDGGINARGEGLLGLSIGIAHSERLIGFLDALFRALEARRIAVAPASTNIKASRAQDSIAFNIKGKLEERVYRPTESERAAEEARNRRNQHRWSSNDFDIPFSEPIYPERHSVFSGKYSLIVEGWIPGVRKTWADGRTQTLESMFHDIAAGLDACLVAEAAMREEREARWRRQEEEAERQARAQARQVREAKRAEFLTQLIAGEDEARRLEAWLARAPPAGAAPHPWPDLIAWAQTRLTSLHRRSDPHAVTQMLARGQRDLFPDPDPLADGAPPDAFDDFQFPDDDEGDDFDE